MTTGMTRHESWDFDEYTDYEVYTKKTCNNEIIVHSRSGMNAEKHAMLLFALDAFTRKAQTYCSTSMDPCRRLFSLTKHVFFELPPNRSFNGVNKPKNVHECVLKAHQVSIGKDTILRAHERFVMIVLPPTIEELERLYAHEIAHTFANHVRFRPDDHHGKNPWDFPQCERDFKTIVNELNFRSYILPFFQ